MGFVERDAVRLVVLDADDRILLFHVRDATYPEQGASWELPGGGIDPGETYVDTAIRELHEETGLRVTPEQVGEPHWRRDVTFRLHGERRLQHEQVLTVRLPSRQPKIDGAQRVGFEDEDFFGFRWWSVEDIAGSAERFYPGRLPALLQRFLAGEEIDEPFENWS